MADSEQSDTFSISKIVSRTALLGAAAAAFGSLVASAMDKAKIDPFGERAAIESRHSLDSNIILSIRNLQREVIQIRDAQDTLLQGASNERDRVRAAALLIKINELSKRQDALESVIMNNPEKALTLPLLKRDVESIKENNSQAIVAIKASVDQVYDLSKWLLGSVVLTVVSLVANTFLQRKQGSAS